MGKEIERKFLVNEKVFPLLIYGEEYRQGYFLSLQNEITFRIRTAGNKGILTIKNKTVGISRDEFEYSIPIEDANFMLDNMCNKPLIEKTRYLIQFENNTWEVDVFKGENEGLIFAEIELSDENETFNVPEWIEEEVTGDLKFYNSSLVRYPFSKWKERDTPRSL